MTSQRCNASLDDGGNRARADNPSGGVDDLDHVAARIETRDDKAAGGAGRRRCDHVAGSDASHSYGMAAERLARSGLRDTGDGSRRLRRRRHLGRAGEHEQRG